MDVEDLPGRFAAVAVDIGIPELEPLLEDVVDVAQRHQVSFEAKHLCFKMRWQPPAVDPQP